LLSSANSINWGRLAPQIAYYFSAYCELLNQGEIALGDPINIVVPTGNFGNILAAYFAKHAACRLIS
jgi:threonine synthase